MDLNLALRRAVAWRRVFPEQADLSWHRALHARILSVPDALPGVHRVDVALQKPFDHETGTLYDPERSS
ncbi:hypothetical protein N8I74_13870 [Chitiniphilus purpureus]|uniref:Uncharacterized protein n=1 Tax=Chitiniphilus purpureus TaxID=2981137 RepID=A0ABY6DJ62_9NEIS|nr:hypothetical protein [Chitiniphilus sp. CD1]UXY14400.1 hypothetical protein N8I74_13870 [Chitiniphilus sp. CD1]